jgi:hypothetical protein
MHCIVHITREFISLLFINDFEYVHACMHMCTFARMYLCMNVCLYVFMHACMYTCTYIYIYIYVRAYVCVRAPAHWICISTRPRTPQTRTRARTRTRTHIFKRSIAMIGIDHGFLRN